MKQCTTPNSKEEQYAWLGGGERGTGERGDSKLNKKKGAHIGEDVGEVEAKVVLPCR